MRTTAITPDARLVVLSGLRQVPGATVALQAARAQMQAQVNAAGLQATVVVAPPGVVVDVSTKDSQDLAAAGQALLKQLAMVEWSGAPDNCPRCAGGRPSHRLGCPLARALATGRALGLEA